MKKRYYAIIVVVLLMFFIRCGESEPKEYMHSRAGFKITAPGGWSKMSEDNEMYEFRSGSRKLIEVGGFDLGIPPTDLYALTYAEFNTMLKESVLEGLDGYCEEAMIANYKTTDLYGLEWGGESAFRVQATGYSKNAEADMVVDILAIVHKETSRMYMFAAQIEEGMYDDAKQDIELMIASFQLLE
ncbi:hypothetical protein AMJ52_07280 [candidate division TA06 bacterium DG_78]|uniref:Uncharacterized protein n=1 Tax=candidate division TA06 bacterium DG_78 TaxID=1703772 RepID=A0A0S7YBK4_UNCT6|nr:MAG: hypothetical protein AMJ52_07280 [candidate division TA06 bacterium DG_78]